MRICWSQLLFFLMVAILAVMSLLAGGCGQKGPLYLPEKPTPSEQQQNQS